MKSKTLYIISGIPGSGKDYFLNKYFGNSSDVKIISRDVIRFSLIENNDEYFSKESLVFSKFCKAIREAFDEYDIVIANATHLNERSRNKLLNSLGEDFLKDKLINCIYMDVPLKVALECNAKREVRKATVPILFIHGSADTFVPCGMCHEIYDNCSSPKKKRGIAAEPGM